MKWEMVCANQARISGVPKSVLTVVELMELSFALSGTAKESPIRDVAEAFAKGVKFEGSKADDQANPLNQLQ